MDKRWVLFCMFVLWPHRISPQSTWTVIPLSMFGMIFAIKNISATLTLSQDPPSLKIRNFLMSGIRFYKPSSTTTLTAWGLVVLRAVSTLHTSGLSWRCYACFFNFYILCILQKFFPPEFNTEYHSMRLSLTRFQISILICLWIR